MADEDVKIIITQKGTIPVYTTTKMGMTDIITDETLTGKGTKSEPLKISDEIIDEIHNAGKVDDVKVNGTSVVANKVARITLPSVIDNTTSESTTDALSANQGRVLQSEIESLQGRGRYLTIWNCATGLAETNPPTSPYAYHNGDYFIVGTVAASGSTNYKPDGNSYTIGVASTTVEIESVRVNDTYLYDGENWVLQSNTQKEVAFSALTGSPYDNTNLGNALNAKQNTLTAGANISIENDVISSTAQESFFRGNFLTWENVPTNVNDYKENYKHEKTPTFGDFMVVADASDYVNPDFSDDPENVAFQRNPSAFTINIIVGNNTISVYYTEIQNNYKTIRELFTSKGYTGIGCEWLKLKYTPGSPGQWYITSTSNYYENNELVSANTDHLLMNTNEPVTSMFYLSRNAGVAPIALFGSWRFSYYGVWATDGKNGWKPEYQVEDVLPVATDNVAGIMKLYPGIGTHIDGTITQNGIKTQLDTKQDKLTAGTNITIDANNVISSTAQESFFRGNFNEWSDVPTDTSLYQEDIHGNRVPKDTDFIIVEDASQFVPSGSLMHKLVVENLAATEAFTIRITDENGVSQKYYYASYARQFVVIDDYYSLRYDPGNPGIWSIKTNDGSPIIIKGTTYSSGQAQLCTTNEPATPFDAGMQPSAGEYTGAWRFAYYGVWSTAGITGWTPQYKIENTLPIADGETLGIAKLYTTTGNNTDGSMTQGSITTALGGKQDTLTAGTNITIENNVISSTSTESFFRGPFANWANVPTTVYNYYPDIYGNRTPRNTDYIIIEDASQVPAGGDTISMTMRTDTYAAYPTQELTTVIGSESYTGTGIFGDGEIEVRVDVFHGYWSVFWKNLKNEVVFGGTTYPIGSDFNIVQILPLYSGTSTATLGISYPYSGTWRFGYRGQWNLEGRGGWKGEYAVEETLPIADEETLGIAKLYTTTGNNTDGSMSQKSITDALGEKQDAITDLQEALDKRTLQDDSLTLFSIGEEEEHVGEIRQYIGSDSPLNKKFHGCFYQWTKTQLGPNSYSYGWEQFNPIEEESFVSSITGFDKTKKQYLTHEANSSALKWEDAQ